MYYNQNICTPRGTFPASYLTRCRNLGYDYNPSEFKKILKPRVDIWEDKEHINFLFDLPGMTREEIKVSVNNDRVLTVEGNKTGPENSDSSKILKKERAFGDFTRSFELPENVDTEKISARLENGVLTLQLIKVKPSEKAINIS